MELEDLLLAYARAWVNLHARSLDGWDRARIFDAFYLLPSPFLSFEEWREVRGFPQNEDEAGGVALPGRRPGVLREGPGWAVVAKGTAGEDAIEERIRSLQSFADRMSHKKRETGKAASDA